MAEDPLLSARARVVHDLSAAGLDTAAVVSTVEDAVADRAWWVQEWPDGARYVAGQVAQDVQEALLERHGLRWPPCPGAPLCEHPDPHELRITPDLGEDPHWVCEESAVAVAALGALPRS